MNQSQESIILYVIKKGKQPFWEPIAGEWVIYTNETMQYPILSNDNYAQSIEYLNNIINALLKYAYKRQ